MNMRRKKRAIILIMLYSLMLLVVAPTMTKAQGDPILEGQRVQFGYWEVVPVIDNLLEDWEASVGTFYTADRTVDDGTSFTNLKDIYQNEAPRNWLIDPDQAEFIKTGEKVSKFTESLKRAKTRAELIAALKPLYDQDAWPEIEAASLSTLFDWASDNGIAPTVTRGTPIVTDVYQSAPPVGFSMGNVYLSDAYGTHWTKVNGGEFEDNYSKAVDTLTTLRVIPNYERKTTYTYRELTYSLKTTFWTQGRAFFSPEVSEESWLLMGWFHQDDTWFFGTIGFGDPYWVPSKTATASFEYVPWIKVEALPVTVNLNFDVIAPLWTARATSLIKTPDGVYEALYNNTWAGFAGATITHIDGGIIDPTLPDQLQDANAEYIAPEGSASGVDTAKVNEQPAPTTSELYSPSPNEAQKVTPAPSQRARNTGGQVATNAEDTTDSSWFTANFDSREAGAVNQVYDEITGQRGLPNIISEDNLVADPDIFDPYWLAATQAQEAALGNVQNIYRTSETGNYTESWEDYEAVSQIEEGDGDVTPLYYQKADAQYIDHEQIEKDTVNVNRKYAEDLALSVDMPNQLSLTLGATMKPAVHSWYRAIDWTYAEFRDQVWSINNREVRREGSQNVIEILAGMEVLNVYMTYTVTFNLIVIDRYDHTFTPGVNRYTGADLEAWIKGVYHDNYYNETYKWQYTPIDYVGDMFAPLFWILFAVFTAFFTYRGASKKRRLALETGGKLSWSSALLKSLGRGILWGLVTAIIVQFVINVITKWGWLF